MIMKKSILALAVTLTALVSCDKVYINGDLDGMWQLQKVEKGDTVEHPQGIYYSFQRHMAQIGKYYDEGIPLRYLGNLYYSGDTLTMSGFRKFLEEEKECTAEELKMFYVFSDSATFIIEKLGDEVLIMKNGERRYSLRKW